MKKTKLPGKFKLCTVIVFVLTFLIVNSVAHVQLRTIKTRRS